MTRLALLLLLLVTPGLAQPPPAGGILPEAPRTLLPVTLPGPEGLTLRALLVPATDPASRLPVVIALHGCGGLGGPDRPMALPRRERDWAARLAARGHTVLFPDSFGSRGFAETCRGGDAAAMPEVQRRADIHAAASWVQAQPWGEGRGGVLLLGWSHGGSTALAAAQAPVPPGLIRAAAALYPGCRRIGRAQPAWNPAVPMLLLLAAEDDWTPPRFCEALVRAAPADAAPVEVVVYPGAVHGFDQPDLPVRTLTGLAGTRSGTAQMGTDPAARADALARVPAFLDRFAGR